MSCTRCHLSASSRQETSRFRAVVTIFGLISCHSSSINSLQWRPLDRVTVCVERVKFSASNQGQKRPLISFTAVRSVLLDLPDPVVVRTPDVGSEIQQLCVKPSATFCLGIDISVDEDAARTVSFLFILVPKGRRRLDVVLLMVDLACAVCRMNMAHACGIFTNKLPSTIDETMTSLPSSRRTRHYRSKVGRYLSHL